MLCYKLDIETACETDIGKSVKRLGWHERKDEKHITPESHLETGGVLWDGCPRHLNLNLLYVPP